MGFVPMPDELHETQTGERTMTNDMTTPTRKQIAHVRNSIFELMDILVNEQDITNWGVVQRGECGDDGNEFCIEFNYEYETPTFTKATRRLEYWVGSHADCMRDGVTLYDFDVESIEDGRELYGILSQAGYLS